MPPAGVPRPDAATYNSTAAFLETELDRAAAAKPNPGKLPLLHRLSRTEYQNVIRDLLALDALPKEMDYSLLLPADNASSGFDNLADLLFVSPTTMERYLDAARKDQPACRRRSDDARDGEHISSFARADPGRSRRRASGSVRAAAWRFKATFLWTASTLLKSSSLAPRVSRTRSRSAWMANAPNWPRSAATRPAAVAGAVETQPSRSSSAYL